MRLTSSLMNHASSFRALLTWTVCSLTMMIVMECTTTFAITDNNYDTKSDMERRELRLSSTVNDENSFVMRQLQPGNDNTEPPTDELTLAATDGTDLTTYEPCFVCGAEDLYVSLPDLSITIVTTTTSCGQVERAGREGLIPSGAGCSFATNAVVDDCECAPITNGITGVPTFGDTNIDTIETTLGTTTDGTPESSPVPVPVPIASPSVIGGPTVILEPTDSSDVPTPPSIPTTDTTFAPTVTVPPSDMISDVVTSLPTSVTLPRGNEPTSSPITADAPTTPRTPSAPTTPSAPVNVNSSASSSLTTCKMVLLSLVVSLIISLL